MSDSDQFEGSHFIGNNLNGLKFPQLLNKKNNFMFIKKPEHKACQQFAIIYLTVT